MWVASSADSSGKSGSTKLVIEAQEPGVDSGEEPVVPHFCDARVALEFQTVAFGLELAGGPLLAPGRRALATMNNSSRCESPQ